jgi:hypothetical protein
VAAKTTQAFTDYSPSPFTLAQKLAESIQKAGELQELHDKHGGASGFRDQFIQHSAYNVQHGIEAPSPGDFTAGDIPLSSRPDFHWSLDINSDEPVPNSEAPGRLV